MVNTDFFILNFLNIRNMPKSKAQKREILDELADKIAKAKSVVFTKFNGLGTKESEEIRRELKKNDSEYFVAKKTLMDIAFKDSSIEGLDVRGLEGQVAAIFGFSDEVAPAKVVGGFKKTLEGKIEFVGGVLENKFISAESVLALSKLPSKQELYAKIAGSLNAPISGFVNALAGNLKNIVGVLNAIKEKKA